jgi:hypothetical protein
MKVRLVHILTEPDTRREIESIRSLSPLGDMGIDYVQQINVRYKGEAWKEVPALSQSSHTNHGPGHYGAFHSFKRAIKDYFTEDLDALVLCECDCVLTCSHEEFVQKLYSGIEFSQKKDVCYLSLGSRFVNGVLQSPERESDENFPEFYITNKIILAHCVVLPKKYRETILKNLDEYSWDSPDLWFNESFWRSGISRFGIIKDRLARQHEGISLIDDIWKDSQ